MEAVTVRTSVSGAPVSLTYRGHEWTLGAEPIRWYERVNWWETARRANKGSGIRVDVEVWQVQARIGHNPDNPLVTLELVRDRSTDTWACRSETPDP